MPSSQLLAGGGKGPQTNEKVEKVDRSSSDPPSKKPHKKGERGEPPAPGLLSYSSARAQCGIVAKSTFGKWIARLHIRPAHGTYGTVWFTHEQVHIIAQALAKRKALRYAEEGRLQRATPIHIGELEHGPHAAKAFLAFQDGLDAAKTVIQLELSPTIIQHLWNKWIELRGGITLQDFELKTLNSYPWEDTGKIASSRDLMDALLRHFAILREEAKCMECREQPKRICAKCHRRKIQQVEASFLGTALEATKR